MIYYKKNKFGLLKWLCAIIIIIAGIISFRLITFSKGNPPQSVKEITSPVDFENFLKDVNATECKITQDIMFGEPGKIIQVNTTTAKKIDGQGKKISNVSIRLENKNKLEIFNCVFENLSYVPGAVFYAENESSLSLVYVRVSGTVNIKDSVFFADGSYFMPKNKPEDESAGIFAVSVYGNSKADINNSFICQGEGVKYISGNKALPGCGIYVAGGDISIENTKFLKNEKSNMYLTHIYHNSGIIIGNNLSMEGNSGGYIRDKFAGTCIIKNTDFNIDKSQEGAFLQIEKTDAENQNYIILQNCTNLGIKPLASYGNTGFILENVSDYTKYIEAKTAVYASGNRFNFTVEPPELSHKKDFINIGKINESLSFFTFDKSRPLVYLSENKEDLTGAGFPDGKFLLPGEDVLCENTNIYIKLSYLNTSDKFVKVFIKRAGSGSSNFYIAGGIYNVDFKKNDIAENKMPEKIYYSLDPVATSADMASYAALYQAVASNMPGTATPSPNPNTVTGKASEPPEDTVQGTPKNVTSTPESTGEIKESPTPAVTKIPENTPEPKATPMPDHTQTPDPDATSTETADDVSDEEEIPIPDDIPDDEPEDFEDTEVSIPDGTLPGESHIN